MPLGASTHLDGLYTRLKLLQTEAARLELELQSLDPGAPTADRRYILEIEARALQEEETKLSSAISDILDRDLQR